MFHKPVRFLFGQAAVLLVLAATLSAGQGVVDPWVTTDRSVNTWNAASIVADVTRGRKGPQEQAIALYSFFRRTMFPYTNRNEYPFPANDQSHMFDFARMVNVYGYSLCTQLNWMFASFCKQSGLFEDARGISVPGHGTAEVKWGGRWHFMDAIVGCYALGRDGAIASIDEIVADSTILTRAQAEHRASVPFCPWDGRSLYPEGALAQMDQWFTYRKYGLAFLLAALPQYKPAAVNEPAGHTMAFELKPGYSLSRRWDHLPGMYNLSYEYYRNQRSITTPSPALLPPHHPAGDKEAADTVNWPIVKPYRKVIRGREAWHYYANGVLSYRDWFTDSRIMRAADSVGGLAVDERAGALQCSAGGTDGAARLDFTLPYVFVGGKVTGRAELVDGSWAAVYLDVKGADQWLCLGVVERGADFEFPIPGELLEERYSFRVLVRLHAEHGPASARLHELAVDAVCQLNMYSLPFLAPGSNRVTVSAKTIPTGTRLAVTCRWEENGWERSQRWIAAAGDESYEVEVAGKDYPRMKEIVMECLTE